MSNLVPERRMNKNGVWSTKHVRAEGTSKAPAKLLAPAPAITDATVPTLPRSGALQASYLRQSRRVWHHHYEENFKPSKKLLSYLIAKSPRLLERGNYEFRVTDLEAYEVLSVVTPDDALPLLECGVTSAEQAINFLREAGLENLVDDYSDLVSKSLQRGISAQHFVSTFSPKWELFRDAPDKFLDAAQYLDVNALQRKVMLGVDGPATTFQKLIDNGEIDHDDLIDVGVSRLHDALDNHGHLIEGLRRIKAGTSLYTPDDIDRWIEDYALNSSDSLSYEKMSLFSLANRHGADYADSLRTKKSSMVMTYGYHQLAMKRGYDAATELKFIDFCFELSDEFQTRSLDSAAFVDDEDFWESFEAGLDPKVAGSGLKNGLRITQMTAVKDGDVSPSVSSGWL